MTITTHRVKQYNSTCKTVVCVNNKPICIVSGNGKTLSNIVSYLSGYKTEIADGQVKKVLDEVLRGDILPKYEAKVVTRGNCMICGKELDKGLFFCKECEAKAESEDA